MRQRGIHDSFHSSLLRVHHPNDDRRFPGRLYSQVAAEVEPDLNNEWSADKIVSHSGSKTNAIFEVLWRAGDKTWLPYDQVRELDILAPYLEARDVENIHELPAGDGKPPTDDPQVFLGSLQFPDINNPIANLILHLPNSHARSISPINMSFRPKDHYKPHPGLAIRPDGFVQLTSVEPNLIIHPAQLLKFLDHNDAVRKHQVTDETVMPTGYEEWAAAYNASKGDNPCEFVTFDIATGLYNCDSFSIPRSILTIPYFDNRYSELRTFGIIDDDGNLVDGGWANVKNALLRPHRDAVRNQARSDARKVERALKKLRISNGPFRGYPTLSQYKAKTVASGLTTIPAAGSTGTNPANLELMPVDQFDSTQLPLA
ncbi:hypothetical protein C0993_011608 [Termitomyces sp. T159_Od127]|nr:hypothetical protein C0993_011608 [Termitomyces sp. T159_Od127]